MTYMTKNNTKSAAKTEAFYNDLTAKVVKLMETEGTNWTKPWTSQFGGMPHNAVTGRRYTGGNVMQLILEGSDRGFASPAWATYNQLSEAGAQVRKGEEHTKVLLFKTIEKIDKATGDKDKFFLARTYNVFNLDQCDIPEDSKLYTEPVETEVVHDVNDIDIWMKSTGATMRFQGASAHFAPVADYIQVPNRVDFDNDEGFYSTCFHELTHWTGHASRIDRDMTGRFGDEAYAAEELIAELGSAFLCAIHGVTPEPRADHARYLNNWIKILKGDSKAIYKASGESVKAVAFLEEAVA